MPVARQSREAARPQAGNPVSRTKKNHRFNEKSVVFDFFVPFINMESVRVYQSCKGEFREWRETMEQCLVAIYGPEVGHREAEAMMILIAGTFICNYNGALTGEISDNIIGYLGNLTQS